MAKKYIGYIKNDRITRSEFHNWLVIVKSMECSETTEVESCEKFYDKLQKWISVFHLNFTGWRERDIEIYIRRTVNGETLENIAEKFNITSERIRQINNKMIKKKHKQSHAKAHKIFCGQNSRTGRIHAIC